MFQEYRSPSACMNKELRTRSTELYLTSSASSFVSRCWTCTPFDDIDKTGQSELRIKSHTKSFSTPPVRISTSGPLRCRRADATAPRYEPSSSAVGKDLDMSSNRSTSLSALSSRKYSYAAYCRAAVVRWRCFNSRLNITLSGVSAVENVWDRRLGRKRLLLRIADEVNWCFDSRKCLFHSYMTYVFVHMCSSLRNCILLVYIKSIHYN